MSEQPCRDVEAYVTSPGNMHFEDIGLLKGCRLNEETNITEEEETVNAEVDMENSSRMTSQMADPNAEECLIVTGQLSNDK